MTLTVAGHRAEAVGQLLEAAGACAVRFEESSGPAVYDEGLAEEPRYWPQTEISAFFLSQAAADFAAHVLHDEAGLLRPETVTDQGWEAQARLGWHAFAIVDDLWIYPNDTQAPPGRLAIHLDPGLAFGTGTHPTTRLCLQWLHASLQETNSAVNVLDFGCGSGILAICALRLGAAHAVGIDVDPLALEVTQQNAVRNGVAARIHTMAPPLDPDARFALVVANILAGPLVTHSQTLSRAVAPNGQLALSGILADQVDRVLAAFPEFTLALTVDEDWCLLHGGRT
ncbi:MAG: 50S ribosomal protein L11 methyltransferase [Acidiferrobacter sp.]